ncbi:tetratricopeptide repeat and ankyrin repeat containing 1 [Elysia marginata]|uniref:Tetratricopeptide repeat and ankyrin repeat containing 1 n=1 Tax=Elysia marginata TaxID=1093978 RepID=A0AAV4G6P8_9GAST|nr:tetratricopeptide repeat and ankyrin repeat containing 1 [Elysia marginata]
MWKRLCFPSCEADLASSEFKRARPRNHLGETECFLALCECTEQDRLEKKDVTEPLKSAFKAMQCMITDRLEGTPTSFYGLELQELATGERTVTWYPAAFPRCRETLNEIKKKELQLPGQGFTVDMNTAISALVQRILTGIEGWAEHIQDQLRQKMEEFNPKCRDKPSTSEYMEILLEAVVFEERWQFGLESIQTDDLRLESKLSKLYPSKKWPAANTLMNFLIPDNAPGWRSNGESTRKLVERVQKCKPAVIQIRRFLKYEWEHPGRVGRGLSTDLVKERCKSTDWVVRAGLFASLLLMWEDLKVDDEIKKLESELSNGYQYYSEWTKKSSKYALFQPYRMEGQDIDIIEHLSSRYLECLDSLICKQDPVDALFAFSKMLVVLGKRAEPSLMPQTKYLVFWLEVFLSIAWFNMGNNMVEDMRPRFYMSTSLFSSVELVNACILGHEKENWTVQKIAARYARKPNRARVFNSRADYFIHFLVGDAQFSKFSLLGQVSSLCQAEPDGAVNPLAERIVLLSLLVLLNIPMGFGDPSNKRLIRREFAKLHADKGLPENLKLLVAEVHRAKTYGCVATAAIVYLSSCYQGDPDQPFLCRCEWYGRIAAPMMWTKLEVGEYSSDLKFMFNEADWMKGPDGKEETRMSAQEEAREKQEEQRRMEEKLEKLKAVSRQQAAQPVSEGESTGADDQSSQDVENLFRQFSQITDTECEICDQEFSEDVQQDASGPARGSATPGGEAIDDIDDLPLTAASDVTGPDLYTKHVTSSGHIERMHQFETFKKCYTKEVYPLLEDIKAFKVHATNKLGNSDRHANRMMKTVEDAIRKFEDKRRQLLSEKMWGNVQELKQAFAPVTTAHADNKSKIEKIIQEQEDKEREAKAHQEKMEDGFVEMGDMDPSDRPVPAKHSGKGKRRGRGRNFLKNLPP